MQRHILGYLNLCIDILQVYLCTYMPVYSAQFPIFVFKYKFHLFLLLLKIEIQPFHLNLCREYIDSKKKLEIIETELTGVIEKARSHGNYSINLKNVPLTKTYPHLKTLLPRNPPLNTALINESNSQVLDSHNYDDIKIINQMMIGQNNGRLSNLIDIKHHDMGLLDDIQAQSKGIYKYF
jgi:hypothetical protein